jgi:hypothetical protein
MGRVRYSRADETRVLSSVLERNNIADDDLSKAQNTARSNPLDRPCDDQPQHRYVAISKTYLLIGLHGCEIDTLSSTTQCGANEENND